MHKSLTLFLLFSSDKLRKEINKVSRIKLVGTEDRYAMQASFLCQFDLCFSYSKTSSVTKVFNFFFILQSADENKYFSKVLRNV